MFSDRTTRELEEVLENGGQCKLEIQRPNGRTFTVYLQEGRAQQIGAQQGNEANQQGGYNQQQGFENQQQGRQNIQEWKVRKQPIASGQQNS